MATSNLKRLLDYLDIPHAALARSINVDASLISRWLSGQRQLKLTSEIINRLSEVLMKKIIQSHNIDWLKHQMELDGLVEDNDSLDNLHKWFKIWLSSDGDIMGKAVDWLPLAEGVRSDLERDCVITGLAGISAFLHQSLASLPDGAKIDIHLSGEETGLLNHDAISQVLFETMLQKNIRVRLIIAMCGNTKAVSQLIYQYTQPIIAGLFNVSVLHGSAQAVTNQTTFIMQKKMVFIVCETLRNTAPPLGMATFDASFIKESQKSFDHSHRSSQPLLQRYDDNAARSVIDIFYNELALPGGLDVIKDSINPIYMTTEEHGRFIKKLGYKGEQLKWRRAEMARYKEGMHKNLASGTEFREMISLKRLNQIIEDGVCKMPALYFFGVGIVYLDASGCLSILEGYCDYLSRFPNFHLIILDEIPELSERSCWHLKQNSHWMLNGWSKDDHIILYTSQLMLTHEFQWLYDAIWNKTSYCEGRRGQTLTVLQDSIVRLKANHHC